MFKYVLKRIGYMFLVLFILSIVIFMIYNLTPSNRAYTDAKADQVAMKQQLAGMSAEAQAKWFEERYEMYQISYGTETNNMILRYLRWVGLYPYADNPYTGKEGKLNGLLQGNFGYSYQYKKDVVNVVAAPMKNTIFINIFATILALAITIPLGIACAVRKNSKFDRFTQVFTIIGYSLPSFIICILFIWVFCALLGWFPASGMKTPGSSYEGFKWFTDRIPVEILACKLRERTGRGRFALSGAVVGGQGRDLLFDRADALGIAFQRLIILVGETVPAVLHRAQQDIAVVFRRCGRGFVHGGENLIPQLLMCAEDGVFLLEQLRGGLAAGIGSFRAGLAARSGAQQQAQAEGKGGCTFDIHL